MQKTNFFFEIVIGEDCSTDGSREIVFDYAKKYPDLIRLITSDKNVGMKENGYRTKMALRGKYMAMCEGDDYWTDPLKLQKQVDFLENNPDYSLCFHDAIILYEDGSPRRQPAYFCDEDQIDTTTTKDVIKKWYIPTASVVLRKEYVDNLPEWFKDVYNGDWGIQMILSTKGKIKYIKELMSIYRRHVSEGSLNANPDITHKYVTNQKIKLLTYFKNEYKGQFDNEIESKIRSLNKEIPKKRDKILKYFDVKKIIQKICKRII